MRRVRVIVDVLLPPDPGEEVWFGTNLRQWMEEKSHILADESIGLIVDDNPPTSTREEFESYLARGHRGEGRAQGRLGPKPLKGNAGA